MDDAVRVREAAEGALADIEPARLRETLAGRLADAEMTPGVLTLYSARGLTTDADTVSVDERAAGVQLIYEGLRLTRQLARDDPWATPQEPAVDATDGSGVPAVSTAPVASGEDAVAADIGVLAADVFVARGFYLLARTEAAHDAVRVVQRFGHDQTLRRSAEDHSAPDCGLESDVFELAVVAGSSAVSDTTPDGLRSYAADLAATEDGLPTVGSLPETTSDRIAALAGEERVSADS
ncbi:MAG: hypothetical protein J07HB67_01541 [halophilic archaeon J07HB67]|jgi:hypothetical protein|nr:MAG: hypothetical protein J07HB67_01541 [halophilic archaeon J07HB67]